MKSLEWITTANALFLAMTAAVNGQPAGEAKLATPTGAPKPPATGPGLLNEWLRGTSDAAQAWDLGGQVRLRYEYTANGASGANLDFRRTGPDNDNGFLLLREKVHLGYRPCAWVNVYAEGRDSSSVGDLRTPNPNDDRFDLHQAYLQMGDLQKFPLVAKVGRQELVYGDERLIGGGDWTNLGRSFDAAKLRFEQGGTWVDAFASRVVLPVKGEFNEANDYDWFSGVYASTRRLAPWQETQLYFLSRNANTKAAAAEPRSLFPLPSARDIYTLGVRLKSLPEKCAPWDYTVELAGQGGSVQVGGTRLKHEAFAAHATAGYTFSQAAGTPRLGLEYDFASGDSSPTDDRNGTFENLFPTNHGKYGYMDFVGWRNLHDVRLMAGAKPLKGLNVTLDYHLFWLADTHDFFYPEAGPGRSFAGGYGRQPGLDPFVGSELNLEAVYNFKPWLAARGGYGHFFVGSYVQDSLAPVGGATDADWVYFQLTFNF